MGRWGDGAQAHRRGRVRTLAAAALQAGTQQGSGGGEGGDGTAAALEELQQPVRAAAAARSGGGGGSTHMPAHSASFGQLTRSRMHAHTCARAHACNGQWAPSTRPLARVHSRTRACPRPALGDGAYSRSLCRAPVLSVKAAYTSAAPPPKLHPAPASTHTHPGTCTPTPTPCRRQPRQQHPHQRDDHRHLPG